MTDENDLVVGNLGPQEGTDKDRREQPHLSVEELAGIAGPLPEGMTAVDLAREARQIGSASRWERYLAQLAEEETAREG